jgi:DNA-binding LacI/PurR family transcriptional regulator
MALSAEPGAVSRKRPVVMADVAKLAGVSLQTVSRVVNESPNVSDATRTRVEEAMRKLGYRPNSVARALVTGRSKTLGVVGFDMALYGPATTLDAIEQAASAADYFLSIAYLQALTPAAVATAVDRLHKQGVDGVVVLAPQEAAVQALLHLPHEIPLVAVEAAMAETVPTVAIDQVEGARLATRHLLELGHETVWTIAGPNDWLEARQRVEGWRTVLESAGRPTPPVLVGDWSAGSGYALGQELAARADVSAVFVGNDQMALGLLRAMHEAGRRVPEDISVVGFDDIPESAYFTPPLTTVRQNFTELGRRSLLALLAQMELGRRTPGRETVAPELVVRMSTGPAMRTT